MKLIAILLMLLPVVAGAVDIELGTGTAHFKKNQDGLWYQEGFPYSEDLKTTPLSIGLSHKFGNYRALIEYLDLGQVFMSALATHDYLYAPGQPGNCVGDCPLYRFVGNGNVKGFVLSAARDVSIFNIPFYVEGGIYTYKSTWREIVLDSTTGTELIKINHEPRQEITPMLGFGIRYSGLDIGVRWFQLESSGDASPALYNRAYTLMLKAYF